MIEKCNEKKQKGFTLVEVIVVAVIVLILSSVAIPMYSGYVRQARQDTADNLAETAAAAANSYWRKTGTILPTTETLPAGGGLLKIYYDPDKHFVTHATIDTSITVRDRRTCASNSDVTDNCIRAKKFYSNRAN